MPACRQHDEIGRKSGEPRAANHRHPERQKLAGFYGATVTLPLEQAAEGYKAMDERGSTKVFLTL